MINDISLNACDNLPELIKTGKVTKVPVSDNQKTEMFDLLHYLPEISSAVTLSNAWVAKFPKGFSKANMMRYKRDGGYGTQLQANGKIKDDASLFSLSTQGVIHGIFSILSAATGQYFLSRIDNQLSLVTSKLDDVLSFLYGENRAELLAEIFFVRRTHENFASIMTNECQRIASIAGLQAAQKIAVKDLEFYLADIENAARKRVTDFKSLCEEETFAWKALNCVELALQTLVIASILEIYLSENYEDSYTDYVRQQLASYMKRCDTVILTSFSAIDSKFAQYHQGVFENTENRQKFRSMIRRTLAPYKGEAESPIRQMMKDALDALKSDSIYYLTDSGDVYVPARLGR